MYVFIHATISRWVGYRNRQTMENLCNWLVVVLLAVPRLCSSDEWNKSCLVLSQMCIFDLIQQKVHLVYFWKKWWFLQNVTEDLTSFPVIPNFWKMKWYFCKYNVYKVCISFYFLYILHSILCIINKPGRQDVPSVVLGHIWWWWWWYHHNAIGSENRGIVLIYPAPCVNYFLTM